MASNPRPSPFTRRDSRAESLERERHLQSLEESRRQTAISEKSLGFSHRAYIVGLVGVLVAAIAIVVPIIWSTSGSAGTASTGTPKAKLELSAVTIGDPREVDAVASDASGASPDEKTKAKASVVDITVKNSGDAPAVVTEADFVLDRHVDLQDCLGSGGESRISAEYTLKIPGTPGITEGPTTLPVTYEKQIRFSVSPRSVDRLAFSFGPEQYTASSPISALYAGHLILKTDESTSINIGEVSVVAPAGKGIESFDMFEQGGADAACMAENSNKVKTFLEGQSIRAPELKLLSERYSKYGT